MLNEDYKNKAINELEKANNRYTVVYRRTIDDMMRLFQSRQRAVRTIRDIEIYINRLANKPREYDKKIEDVKIRYLEFNNQIEEIKKLDEMERMEYNNQGGGGILLGVGGAALVPSAAMAVAMTFGTASTGTAIASLSGIAATNAALSWLGGGALAVGGAGMAGGQALISMAGPIGWVIGGVSITGIALRKALSNKDIAEKAEKAMHTIIREKERIQELDAIVCAWNKETIKLSNELSKKLTVIRHRKDYSFFTEDDKRELAIMMNMTEVLSKKLRDKVS